jgi:1-acyl-sn-glycerol-3-phosphate acyltransferase
VFWWLMKFVLLGPLLRLAFRPHTEGLESVPRAGPAILAATHVSALDAVLLPLVIRRRKVHFLAKAEYFDPWYAAWFFRAAGTIPVRREDGTASEAALQEAVQALREGRLVGIFPEGTRSPDGRLHRGRTGVARLAIRARVPVIPVAILRTFEAMPTGARLPRPRTVRIRFGRPLYFDPLYDVPIDRFMLRSATDRIMYEIRMLSGQEYVDQYASRLKRRPARTQPGAEAGRAEGPTPKHRDGRGTTPGDASGSGGSSDQMTG